MFAGRPEAAAEELARVCRKGGRIALTTWVPDGNLFRMFQLMGRYAPSPSPAPPSPFEWGRTERIQQLLELTFSLRFEKGISYYREPSGEAAWNTFSKGYGPHPIAGGHFVAFHDGFRTELGICVPREYWLTAGFRM